MSRRRFPALFLSHGGGPWPFVPEMRHLYARSEAAFTAIPSHLPATPRAIIAISGHWEAPVFTVATSPAPPTEYDYYGFPEETYHIRYPAPGSPLVAERVRALLEEAGFECGEDPNRGFDHGVFVPLHLCYPQAEIPVVMLSLRSDLDPAEHLRMGAALAPLRDEGVLILGSGLTYHNLRRFGPAGAAASVEFEAWLFETLSLADVIERDQRLVSWQAAPSARLAHPREDHLIPLMVVAGASGAAKVQRLALDEVWSIAMGSYLFTES